MAAVKVFLVICALAFVALDLDAKKVPGGQSEKKEVPKPENGKKKINEQFLDPIYPGTKWCGAGNIAANYSDLGKYDTVDMCCRDHDFCKDQISAMSYNSNYSLSNLTPVTKLSCTCDQTFFSCLKAVNSSVSSAVGNIYFNTLIQPCFREDYPIIRCKTFYLFTLRCKEYVLDTTQPKKYQYFDNPLY